jgi:hypothetical protein
MHWIKVTNPEYEQSRRYGGQVGEVVGKWGPAIDSRDGFLVEFADGSIVGVSKHEIEEIPDADVPTTDRQHAQNCR